MAVWIREQLTLHLAALAAVSLDSCHLSENARRARRRAFGEESPEGKAWAQRMHHFEHEGCAVAWEEMIQWHAGERRRKRT